MRRSTSPTRERWTPSGLMRTRVRSVVCEEVTDPTLPGGRSVLRRQVLALLTLADHALRVDLPADTQADEPEHREHPADGEHHRHDEPGGHQRELEHRAQHVAGGPAT